jgi:hypothetical protein
MSRLWLTALFALFSTVALAQDIEVTTLDPIDPNAVIIEDIPIEKAEIPTLSVDQAILRGIDKLDGTAGNIILGGSFARKFGLLELTLGECRYPEDNPSGEAFAYLTIKEAGEVIFSGWMIASSPALNALDHQRYDVWLLRCRVSNADGGSE